MKRSTWAAVLLLGASFGLVVYLLFGRPLPEWVTADAGRAEARLEALAKQADETRERVSALIAEDRDLLAPLPQVQAAQKQVEERRAALQQIRKAYDEGIEPVLSEDEHGDAPDLIMKLAALNGQIEALAKTTGPSPVDTVQRFLEYKRDGAKIAAAAREAATAALPLAQDPLITSGLDETAAKYPEAREKLEAKRQALIAGAAQVAADLPTFEALAAAQPPDVVATGLAADRLLAAAQALQATKAGLLSDFGELRQSVDKILVDMKEEGDPPRYYHQYKVVENGAERDTGWLEVDAQTWNQHLDHLGMTIESKPEGVLAEDATRVASPPGYNYVGNPRYGQWQGSGAGSFWVFYGQYALMRDLMWGRGGYQPVSRGDYDGWNQNRQAGKPYFGQNREFGTQGSHTKSRYAGSRYMSDRAARSVPQSTADTPSSSRRSGSSFRSSRYRSGSFGGGGK